ncbi:MAG: four helix bundle protein [Flavobacteriales bacterium]|nr:four helix bundle protein [Flavobacteriales bacterium]
MLFIREIIWTIQGVGMNDRQFGDAANGCAIFFAKFSKADRKNYFITTHGSIFECVAILDILMDENLIAKEDFVSRAQKADELSRIFFAMIRNLETKQ